MSKQELPELFVFCPALAWSEKKVFQCRQKLSFEAKLYAARKTLIINLGNYRAISHGCVRVFLASNLQNSES